MDKFTDTSIQDDYLQVKYLLFQQVKVYLFHFPGKVLASTFFKALLPMIVWSVVDSSYDNINRSYNKKQITIINLHSIISYYYNP